jgi:coenzyme F420 hydrogenase subunit beta
MKTIADVVRWRLCIGCGACASVCPERKIRLMDFPAEGIRPIVDDGNCSACNQCLRVCPVVETDFGRLQRPSHGVAGVGAEWGSVLEIWEGHASDPRIRFKGASGGVLTALSAYCLQHLGFRGVLHTGQDPVDAVRNRTRLTRSREELIAATGSRYSPASVCNGLHLIDDGNGLYAMVGRPAEVAALRNAQRALPEFNRKVGVVFSFFCAESPSTRGTTDLLRKLGFDPAAAGGLRYRGEGWPGHFSAVLKGERDPAVKIPYHESWSFLQAYRPWAAHLWPDGTGELADIACGDPWYMAPDGKNPGVSLVVVRTERGREILRGAMEQGYLELRTAEPWKLIRSQMGLIGKKGEVWGRLLVMRLFGLPVPRFQGSRLFECWRRLSVEEKARSTLGTARRIISRRLYRPITLDPGTGVLVNPAMLADAERYERDGRREAPLPLGKTHQD